MTPEAERIIQLEYQVKGLVARLDNNEEKIKALEEREREENDKDRSRLWAGVITLGGIVLSLVAWIGNQIVGQ